MWCRRVGTTRNKESYCRLQHGTGLLGGEIITKLYLLTFNFDVHTAILKGTVRTRLFKRHGIYLKSLFKLLKSFIRKCSCTQSKLLLDLSGVSLTPTTVFSNNAVQINVVFEDDSTILSLHKNTKKQNVSFLITWQSLCQPGSLNVFINL